MDKNMNCEDICIEIGRKRKKMNDGKRIKIEKGRREGK